MTTKQSVGLTAPDGSTYVTFTDGVSNLVTLPAKVVWTTTHKTGTPTQAADGSLYLTVTDGIGNLL